MGEIVKRNAQSVKSDAMSTDMRPGAFKFTSRYGDLSNKIIGMNFRCPCGCGGMSSILFEPDAERPQRPVWLWDGNQDRPTLSPSILRSGECGWHGFLRAGVFEEC